MAGFQPELLTDAISSLTDDQKKWINGMALLESCSPVQVNIHSIYVCLF